MSKVYKKLEFQEKARAALKRGVDILAQAVGSTLGPKGRNVVFEREFQIPVVSNDGVSIAREIVLEDRFENMGVELVREAAIKTNDNAGDGTTTSIVIAHELLNQAFLEIKCGKNPMDIKRVLEKESQTLLKELQKYCIPIDDDEMITQVATISANNDREIGEAIMRAVKEVGKDGVITVEEKYGTVVEMEMQKGFQFGSGIVHPWMVTDTQRMEAAAKDVPILCVQSRLTSVNDIEPLMIYLSRHNLKQCVLVAPEIGQDALKIICEARKSGDFHIIAIKAPFIGERQMEYIEDIAIYTGGQMLTPHRHMKEVSDVNFGVAKRVISTRAHTTIIDGSGEPEAIAGRVASIQAQYDQVDNEFDKEKLKERVSKLQGGIAVLKVGAVTEPEMKEKKYRIEDAINATQAAVADGVVIGGGMTFYHLSKNASEMAKLALQKVFCQICVNAGVDQKKTMKRVVSEAKNNATDTQRALFGFNQNYGYNALTDSVENLLDAGILDPYRVVKSALENAFSAAMMVITSDTLIVFGEDPAKARIL